MENMRGLLTAVREVTSRFTFPLQRSFVFIGKKDFIIYRLGLL